MNIKSTFIWTSFHTIIKILSGIIMNKLIAIYLGPPGLAIIGQFQNFVGIVSRIASGSIQTGIVKYTAEHKEDKEYLSTLLRNSLLIVLSLSVASALFLIVFADILVLNVMLSSKYAYIVYFLAFSIVFNSLNIYVLAILKGLGEVKLFTIVNIVISVVTLLMVSMLTILYGLDGALLAIVATQSLVFLITYILIYKKFGNYFFELKGVFINIDSTILKKMFNFALTTFSVGVVSSAMMIIVRNNIVTSHGVFDAGIWEAGWRMMLYFNMILMAPFSVYYFPKFSASKKYVEIKELLLESVKFIMPLIILAIIVFSFIKNEIIVLLFSDEFISLVPIVMFMLVAESIRIFGLVIGNAFMAKAMNKNVVLTELLFALMFVLLSYIFMNTYGLVGISFSYIISSIIFFTFYILQFYYYSESFDVVVNSKI